MIPEQVAAVIMLGILLIMVIGGVHLAFALLFLAAVFGLLYQGLIIFPMSMLQFFGTMESEELIAVPLFVFMGTLLEKTEVAEGVFQSLYELFGPVGGDWPSPPSLPAPSLRPAPASSPPPSPR